MPWNGSKQEGTVSTQYRKRKPNRKKKPNETKLGYGYNDTTSSKSSQVNSATQKVWVSHQAVGNKREDATLPRETKVV